MVSLDLLQCNERNGSLQDRNHNWFHGVSSAIQPVPVGNTNQHPSQLSRPQKVRVSFYRALVELVYLLGGHVLVADTQAPDISNGDNIGAILLWLQPNVRLGAFDLLTLWRSGFLSLLTPWKYGLTGFNRIQNIFEANINSMFDKTLKDLPPNGYRPEDCGFVQMVAINTRHVGKGLASALLEHQIDQHFSEYPDKPVILDTSTSHALRTYERLGFRLLAQMPVDTGTDADGIKLKPDAGEATRTLARETCVQRVMIRLPPETPLDFEP